LQLVTLKEYVGPVQPTNVLCNRPLSYSYLLCTSVELTSDDLLTFWRGLSWKLTH